MKVLFVTFFILLGILTVGSFPTLTHAQATASSKNFVPLTNLPVFTTDVTTASNFPLFFNDLYKYAIGIAATLAVLEIMYAGVMYMGGGSVTETSEARHKIAFAILGLVLVLSPVIVFSIINPKILSLSVGFDKLQPTGNNPAPVNPATVSSNPTLAQQMCSGYSSFQWAQIPLGESCSAHLQAGWVNLQDNVCCASPAPTGQICCGYDKNYVAPVTPALLSQYQYSLAYQSTDYSTNKACLAYDDKGNFTDQNACLADFQKVQSASKGPTAVARSCTDTGSHTPTGPGWATLKNLPACPTQ